MGLLDQFIDPETMAQVRALNQPSEEDRQAARNNALMNAGFAMMMNNGGPNKSQALFNALGAGGMAGMGAYQNTIDASQRDQQQSIQQAMMLSKMKKEQEQQSRLNALSDRIGSALAPQTQEQTVGYKFNVEPDANNVRFNPGGEDAYISAAKNILAKQASGKKISPDEQLVLDQVKSRISPVTQQVQAQPQNIESIIRNLGVQYGIQDPERGKLLLQAAEQFKPQTVQAGSFQRDPSTGNMAYIGDPTKGVTVVNGRVVQMPGAADAMASLTGAQKRAEAEASGFDPNKRLTSIYETGVDPLALNGSGVVNSQGLPKKFTDQQTNAVTDPAAVQQRMGAIAAFDKTMRTAEELKDHPGLNGSVGLRGSIPALPGTDSANFIAQLDTLKSQTFLPMVQQLKGMGALSNAEGEKLTAAVGALDRKMSAEAFKRSLNSIISDLNEAKSRAAYVGVGQTGPQGFDLQSLAAEELKRRGK